MPPPAISGPVAGAVGQEGLDLLAVLNALRAAFPPKVTSQLGEEAGSCMHTKQARVYLQFAGGD